jgi:hypothetical protein
MKLTKSQIKQIIKEELEAVLGEVSLEGLESYNVLPDSIRPGKPEGVPMWDRGGHPVSPASDVHMSLVTRCAAEASEPSRELCNKYLAAVKGGFNPAEEFHEHKERK